MVFSGRGGGILGNDPTRLPADLTSAVTRDPVLCPSPPGLTPQATHGCCHTHTNALDSLHLCLVFASFLRHFLTAMVQHQHLPCPALPCSPAQHSAAQYNTAQGCTTHICQHATRCVQSVYIHKLIQKFCNAIPKVTEWFKNK
ncbi:hypothetical protein E2C01_001585 [Portunus trituberculatus]|uniref:Uncharacterized protein n=1 Tax=Portunus trituberculatus TaxID=210409 RepID=A0A5B7CKT4_PORTR|nr:hypothetical protein [Portunus trituberculatus]